MKSNRIILMVGLILAVVLLAACQPITAEKMQTALAGQVAATQETAAPVDSTKDATAAVSVSDGAMATVTARSLRVRGEPSENAEVVAGIREGEQYQVIGRSSDGLWLELAIPRAPQGSGWVSANFVTVAGSITDTEVATAPTAVATEAATAAPVEEATEAAATPVPTEEVAEATPTEAPVEEVTPAPTEEAAEPVATEAPAEETAVVTPPPAGFALVTAEGARLRVRAEPSTDAEIVGWVQPGEVVPVEEVSADGLWVKLSGVADTENPNGGWVSTEFVVLGQ